ncbi:MAG TPA: ligase-associated DNA damage response endonuclease PdeM [Rhodobacteraceae bacterium]|nr:ligase-associated DNA damage response endonuclease PdeM [Paracoccaceae bacterium]
MNGYSFPFAGTELTLLPSGALWWPTERLLCVSDLHLGRSERFARNAGALLPPYEIRDTLTRLEADIEATQTARVVCLGDTFDDAAVLSGLAADATDWLIRLMAGRSWVWIEGNHDPGPVPLGGTHLVDFAHGPLTFRHIAAPSQTGEISGHYHPKVSLRGRSRPCLLVDAVRVILPAYGTYTGGLRTDADALASLMGPRALAVMTGPIPRPLPMPR